MLKSILVGVSGSPSSHAAVRLAIQWASNHATTLIGIGVVDEELLAPAESIPLGGGHIKAERDQIVLADAERHIDAAVREFVHSCRTANVPHKVLKLHGRIADRICEQAQRVDLVILGRARRETTDSAAPLSESLETIIKRAVRPVVSVTESVIDGNCVVVAYDGSLQAARCLAAFAGLGLFHKLPIRLVTVERSLGDLAFDTSLASEFLESHGYRVEVNYFTSKESPAEGLLRNIDELKPALVVLGAYGKSWLREVLIGSVTSRLLQQADVPLFLFH